MSLAKFSLSRFAAPHLSFDAFLNLSHSVGMDAIEILSSDIPDLNHIDNTKC